ncbi:UNVERIFIED_CONTAM: hypothetical protein FKN15_041318 [Acipenser sinensis]
MSGLFKIDPLTGSITTAAIMDREIWTHTKVVVTATDRGSPKLAGIATLTVVIVDLNDNSPTIPLPQEIRVPENTLIGTELTQVTGNDVDSGPVLSYTLLLDGSSVGKFGIHRYGGVISLTAPLDFEERSWYTLTICSSDSKHKSEANLTVLVEDVNDNAPAFTQDLYQVTLPEHSPPGSSVVTVTATDRDSGGNGKITYRVMSSTRGGFYIDPSNGTLFISQRAEFDPEKPSVSVVIEARDGGTPALSSNTTVQVQVSDVNDNAPRFKQSEYKATVSEDLLPGSTILTIEAVDSDLSRENCGFDFAIASGNPGNAFQIESSVRFLEGQGFQTVGTLILVERLDFETMSRYNLSIVASDRGVPQRSSSVPAVITITDSNDNPPSFGRTEYNVVLSEGAAAGTELLRLSAYDPDSTPDAVIRYVISSGDEAELFGMDEWTGALKLLRPLDREAKASHMVIVQALDGQGQFALAPVSVEVKDINDNKPYFPLETLTASIRENQPTDSLVTVLHAIDFDTGVYGQVRYYMVDQNGQGKDSFSVNQASGEVRSKLTFDFEKANTFQFMALALDTGNYSATVTVQVLVTGEDEYDPVFASQAFLFEVPEGATKGQSIGQVLAKDEDAGADGIVLYTFANGSPYFGVNETTGVIYLKMDSQSRHSGGRSKRDARQMNLEVEAHSPLPASRITTAQVNIDVTHTSFGLPSEFNFLLVIVIAASLVAVVILVVIAVALFVVRSKRKKKEENDNTNIASSGTAMQKLDESHLTGVERIYHQALPGYTGEQTSGMGGTGGGAYTRGGSLDPSHSSGRGSAEAEAAEDDEIRMINEYPRVSSISSSMQDHLLFEVPEGATKGQSIGQVLAKDEDAGADGIVLYTFANGSPYFGVNETTGVIYLKMDSQSRHSGGRSKRDARQMNLEVKAHSPLPTSRITTAQVNIDVTHTSFGLPPGFNFLLVIVIAASLAAVVILVVIAVALFVVRSKRKKKEENDNTNIASSGTAMQKLDESHLTGVERIYHQALPGYTGEQTSGMGGTGGGAYTRGGSLDPSHSSGRGSAEAEAAEDDEIRMINEYPRVSSISSSMQDHLSTRGPDSGIQQDADQLSDISCEPGMEAGQWFKGKKIGSLSGTLLPGQHPIYRDEGGGYLGVGRGLNISHPKDYAFPEDGKPSVDGSLTAIVASDEELRGSYNWDYLLDWCPQFQPLASVFTEIARLKDESAPPNPRRPFQPKAKTDPKPRIDPPPLITSVAHPGAKSVPPKPAIGRTFPHLASLRRSPISHEGSISSAAMSPSFSPSLSPLAARSPAVSPFGVTQGPSASMISTTEHSLDHPGEAEMRI